MAVEVIEDDFDEGFLLEVVVAVDVFLDFFVGTVEEAIGIFVSRKVAIGCS